MSDPSRLVIRRLHPEDWQEFREIRLRALAQAPEAFSSTLAEAVQLDEAEWRRRLDARAQFIAIAEREAVGTAGGIDVGARAELISMWVEPAVRRSEVGSQLVSSVVEWARNRGHSVLWLWVAEGNLAAEGLYAKQGFTRTGKSQPVDARRPTRGEFEMSLRL
jgi:GNAT superfamily N-acetyltransferase